MFFCMLEVEVSMPILLIGVVAVLIALVVFAFALFVRRYNDELKKVSRGNGPKSVPAPPFMALVIIAVAATIISAFSGYYAGYDVAYSRAEDAAKIAASASASGNGASADGSSAGVGQAPAEF